MAGGRAENLSLPETVAGLRSKALLPSGCKLLIVLDQFEQWLHADHEAGDSGGELVRALRQCDGTNVQCLVLVRDDFAMAAARFMRKLEIRVIENDNFATVDAFDLKHARKVLREFGLAYYRFREEDHAVFDRFLDLAVAELAEDGKIAPVRLALFAQMLKDKPWSPATLKNMRGLEGIGVKFLEESLDGESANPEHRLNVLAARHVLRALLPYGATDIKGHMRSYEELLEVSGYARRPADFDTLLSILGTELRLITPTDPRGADAGEVEQPDNHAGRYYHLTHDYLVPSLREWLTRKERADDCRPGHDSSRRTDRGMDGRSIQPVLALVVGVAGDRAVHEPLAAVAGGTAARVGCDPVSCGASRTIGCGSRVTRPRRG